MRNTRTLALALAAGTMLLATACSKGGGEGQEAAPGKVETPAEVSSGPAVEPGTTAPAGTATGATPAETNSTATPETKAPAGK